jgi:beta-phosphoglucomutase family hydrolase
LAPNLYELKDAHMQEKRILQAVLWDMDGVIVDTYEGHFLSWKQSLEEVGQPFDDEIFRTTFGMNNRLILAHVFGRELDEEFIWKVGNRKEEIFRQDIKGMVQALPGVKDWLERFKDMGLKQAVASSAPQANIDALLDELGIRDYFQAEASGSTLKGKPDPAVFLLAAQKLGVDPVNCLVIEDAIAGVEAAKRAGCRCVAVLTTNPAEVLSKADCIVKDLSFFTEEMLKGLFLGM